MRRDVSLNDKFDLAAGDIFLSGTQALVRLAMMQAARDREAGHNTAGYVTGYRGSPLGGLDQQFARARKALGPDILFQPALNEDLGATAVWGTQQANLSGEGRYDGVFAMWYGKGPGVDRSGDAFRHANLAGTALLGGVLALMGDDHTCESSTTAHQSEFGMINAMIPVLSPSNVQEILDFGLLGIAMSRYSGLWVGLKCVKDTVESTATVDGRTGRVIVRLPDFALPDGGLNIRPGFDALGQEARLHAAKLPAAIAFASANGLNPIVHRGGRQARLGIVGTGKSWLDVMAALDALGLDEVACADLGIRLMKVGCPWPLPADDVRAFADGLEHIMVVEEKRPLIEPQMKEALYGRANAPTIVGKTDEEGRPLFLASGSLDANHVAREIGRRLCEHWGERGAERVAGPLAEVERLAERTAALAPLAERKPYFCAGCPHSSSTVVPEGARAAAGIGCHFMALNMDRSTEGFTQMGGEGAQWIGEAPFSTRPHIFQNIGDGTYNHSGSLAIRAAAASGINITFKILFNDAVAMTGGQTHDGNLTVPAIVAQMLGEGAKAVAVVSDEPEKYPAGTFASTVTIDHRDDVIGVQERLAKVPGVTVMVYDQTCASEKRRRRKRGAFPDPDWRIVINERVCEGCGDCGVQSNCVAIQPVETAFGRKRQIDQSTCNKDASCLKGFCPSFVTVHGAKPKMAEAVSIPDGLPEPERAALDGPMGLLVTGVGGTGVVTVGAVIGMAAHLEGLAAGIIDMAGLAQKGGAVISHIRIAERAQDVTTIRVGPGSARAVLACDIAVAGGTPVLSAIGDGAVVIANTHEQLPGDFTRNVDFTLPGRRVVQALEARAKTLAFNATDAARRLFGDTIAANTMVMGAAFQSGALPLSAASITRAIEMNGAAVPMNLAAFRAGRLLVADRARFDTLLAAAAPKPLPHRERPATVDAAIARYKASLTDYQSGRYARRFEKRIAAVRRAVEAAGGSDTLVRSAADALYRLMAVKDEIEVARLYSDGGFAAQLADQFDDWERLTVHLAPPLVSQTDPRTGRPRKRPFGPWVMRLFPLMARLKPLRGTFADPFGHTQERRDERALLRRYEATLDHIAATLTPPRMAAAEALARWPLTVRGYGPVRAANTVKAQAEAERLRNAYDADPARVLVAAE